MSLKEKIRTIPNFPKEGIMFRDITSLLKDPQGLKQTIDDLVAKYESYSGDNKIDIICGIEARGFIIGAAMAYKMNLGFIPIRKKGKLPGKTISQDYQLEYGTDTIEIHDDALDKGHNILLVDDLLATGGTALGANKLIEKCGARVVEACFIVDLPDLGGGSKLEEAGIPWFALVDFDGE
jgi:adenine phosphoribosyltransferase